MNNSIQAIQQQFIIPLFYHNDAPVCIALTKALYQAGIRVIEFTNRGPQAMPNFAQLVQLRNDELPGLLLGVGTIHNEVEVAAYQAAGADFLVSPFFTAAISDAAQQHHIRWIPGCLTPTEIKAAQLAGWDCVKLFPANIVGLSYIKSIQELFPGMQYMATGGIDATAADITAWQKAGAAAIGLGSKLITADLLNSGNYAAIEQKTKELLQLVQEPK
jgi:2-dehydro-3-deoxyphosphogluconate aldolase/(4S)-4-hydroxy-2-oxoglutarate aldolase